MKKTGWQLINEMDEKGELKILVTAGICKPSIMTDLEMVRRVDAKISTGKGRTMAMDTVAAEFNTCRRSVYRVFKYMRECGKP